MVGPDPLIGMKRCLWWSFWDAFAACICHNRKKVASTQYLKDLGSFHLKVTNDYNGFTCTCWWSWLMYAAICYKHMHFKVVSVSMQLTALSMYSDAHFTPLFLHTIQHPHAVRRKIRSSPCYTPKQIVDRTFWFMLPIMNWQPELIIIAICAQQQHWRGVDNIYCPHGQCEKVNVVFCWR